MHEVLPLVDALLRRSQRSTTAGSPRRRYTEPNRASIRSQAGNTRTRTISPDVDGCQPRLRQETHCGQSEYAPHRDADAVIAGADPDHLLVQQRHRRALRAAVLFGQLRPALRQVQHQPGRHVVEVDEPESGGSAPRHAESIGKPGIDVTRAVELSTAASPRANSSAPTDKSSGRSTPATTRLASTSRPVAAQAANCPPTARATG